MKKFLIELAWSIMGIFSAFIWVELPDLIVLWYDWLWVLPLSLIPLTGMVVGFRRGFPDGIWGIK